ncbi:MAG: UDP-N-acetylmuramate--L-alanine ligase [Rickettsiaceae bacterium H1]|nr:UDP-N-acetylmuramate--L-alanine ligase [Rickettsiaceae bacterium H1]
MNLNRLLLNKHIVIHIVGIGGIGMSAIAKLLHNIGYVVQGSDFSDSCNVRSLCKSGIRIFSSHDKSNIIGASLLVRSSAVLDDNLEVEAAKESNILVISRGEILMELLKLQKYVVAISGTHGKTTTTAMLGSIFESAEYDPTIINGGIMNLYNDNVRLGNGSWSVVEADESDGTFTLLEKHVSVVTNIEIDHIDYYKSYENLLNHFKRFIAKIPSDGFAVACEKSYKMLSISSKNIITYGLKKTADVYASDIWYYGNGMRFDVLTSSRLSGVTISDVVINSPGEHNISNALASVAVAVKLGIHEEKIKLGLNRYKGVKRRFSMIGKFCDAEIIDDYAHHPTEIIETIKAARNLCVKGEKVIAIVQPHRFTRVKALFDQYVDILSFCSHIIFLPVFAAGEKIIHGCNSKDILASRRKTSEQPIRYVEDFDELKSELQKEVSKGDKILFMGAGDITNYAYKLCDE